MLSLDWNILWVVINLLILFLLLKKFLFGPVTKMMDKREQLIKDDLNNAANTRAEADKLKSDYENTIKNAHNEAAEITNKAKADAAKECDIILADAREESARILKDAQTEAANQKAKVLSSAKVEIADLAVMAAAKVINKNIDEKSDKEIAESFLSEVGVSK